MVKKRRYRLKNLKELAKILGWEIKERKYVGGGTVYYARYWLLRPGKPALPCVDLEMVAAPIGNELKRRGFIDAFTNPMRD